MESINTQRILKKLLILTPYFNRTGSANALIDIINEYSKKYDIYLYLFEKPTRSDLSRVNIHKSLIAPSGRSLFFFYLLKFVKKLLSVDIAHLHLKMTLRLYGIDIGYINTLHLLDYSEVFKKFKIPYAVHIHEHLNSYFSTDLQNVSQNLSGAFKIIAPSNLVVHQLPPHLRKTCKVYYSGLHALDKTIEPEFAEELWNEHHLDRFNFVWATSGSFIETKGADLVLEILDALRQNNACLIWMGYTYPSTFMSRLYEELNSKQIDNLVLTGSLSHPKLLSVLSKSSGFISLSRYESFGLSILDAYYMKLPIVAFDEVGISEVLSGLHLIERYSIKDFVSKMNLIMTKNEGKVNYPPFKTDINPIIELE